MKDHNITIRGLAFAATAALATIAVPAHAQYLADTGTKASFDSNWGLSPDQSLAAYFTVTSAATISSVEGYFSYPGRATISIASGDALPSTGPRLYSGTLMTSVDPGFDGLFGLDWTLAAGSYWLVFESPDSISMPDIALNPLENYAFTYQGIWNSFAEQNVAVRIGGTYGDVGGAVPESATWAMLLIGFGATGYALRRGRQVVRVRYAV